MKRTANQKEKHLTRTTVRFFEHYPHQDNADEITYELKDGKYCSPQWKYFTNADFQKLINT